jgi:hypothetical protein
MLEALPLSDLKTVGHFAVRQMQLAHIKECSCTTIQWLFKTHNLEVAQALAQRIHSLPVIVFNGELCLGIVLLVRIERPVWKVVNY